MWEQVGILILIGLISLIDWAMRKSRERRAARQMRREEERPPNPYVKAPPQREKKPQPRADDEFRKFMEALGMPTETFDPRPSRPPTRPPFVEHREPAVRKPAVESTPPPPLPESTPAASGRAKARKALPTQEERALAARLASVEKPIEGDPIRVSERQPLRKSLRTHEELRKAIVAREILGPPLGLRD